jgi:hypothetical protein
MVAILGGIVVLKNHEPQLNFVAPAAVILVTVVAIIFVVMLSRRWGRNRKRASTMSLTAADRAGTGS